MAHLLGITGNLSMYTIPAAWVIAFAPHAFAATQSKAFDLRAPRTYAGRLTKERILRHEAAHANNMENLGFFATAVLAGNFAGLPDETLNALSIGYLVSRAIYNIIYPNCTTQAMSGLRTLVYTIGLGCVMTLYVLSGHALRNVSLDFSVNDC
ncbi:hypothetical protein F5884DRAFT_849903 [Xylogone sp. PMI_703]|nr:hypothetical protein F5884DRAFT_849903 [Xylogone sp. PMI_703]